jgi:hypothetical protein
MPTTRQPRPGHHTPPCIREVGVVVLDLRTLRAVVVDTDDGPALQLADAHDAVLIAWPTTTPVDDVTKAVGLLATAALEYGHDLHAEANQP